MPAKPRRHPWRDGALLLAGLALQLTPQPWPSWLKGATFVAFAVLVALEVYRLTKDRGLPVKLTAAAAGVVLVILAWQKSTAVLVLAMAFMVSVPIIFVVQLVRLRRGEDRIAH